MTDFRALCAELLDWAERTSSHYVMHPDVILRARAALAQPEPQGPTDEELKAAYWDAFVEAAPCGADESWLAGLRAVARWGRPAIAPIPVSERLPGAEDCDAEGRCWWWDDDDFCWVLDDWARTDRWLPAHALPLPGQPAPDAPAR